MDDTEELLQVPPLELSAMLEDRQRFIQRLVLSLALDPPKALERRRRALPAALRRKRAGR